MPPITGSTNTSTPSHSLSIKMTEKESSIQITMSSPAVKGTSVSPRKSTKQDVLPGHNGGAKTFVQSYSKYIVFCTSEILWDNLKRGHFSMGRGQKFAKFADE